MTISELLDEDVTYYPIDEAFRLRGLERSFEVAGKYQPFVCTSVQKMFDIIGARKPFRLLVG